MSKPKIAWRPLAAVAYVFLLAACADPHPIVASMPPNNHFMAMTSTAGNVLATPAGMTLYTYDKDVAGQPTCAGECAQYWPPFLGDTGSVPADFLTLIPLADGTKQWAANGKPLYTFIQDKKAGEVKGEDFHNVWHVVRVQ